MDFQTPMKKQKLDNVIENFVKPLNNEDIIKSLECEGILCNIHDISKKVLNMNRISKRGMDEDNKLFEYIPLIIYTLNKNGLVNLEEFGLSTLSKSQTEKIISIFKELEYIRVDKINKELYFKNFGVRWEDDEETQWDPDAIDPKKCYYENNTFFTK